MSGPNAPELAAHRVNFKRAHREVAAAESLQAYRRRLERALEKVGKALAEEAPHQRDALTLVLPIDGIDRSTQHLRDVFRFADWATCPHLVLVLGGGRHDMHAFLERSYWTELVAAEAGVDGHRHGRDDENEALSLARRQAAAAMRKTLPPNHRIEVESPSAKDVLAFQPGEHEASIADKLGGFRLEKVGEMTLLDLLRPNEQELTDVGQLALQLPTRSILDLDLLLCGAAHREPSPDEATKEQLKESSRIARFMLRLVAAESDLPDWAVRTIQDEIVRRTADNNTRITLSEGPKKAPTSWQVSVRRTGSPGACRQVASPPREFWGELQLRGFHEPRVTLTLDARRAELPPAVGAWLLVLYDVLIFHPDPLVCGIPDAFLERTGPRVVTRWHTFFKGRELSVDLAWPRPNWWSFYEHGLMNSIWNEHVLGPLTSCSSNEDSNKLLNELPKQGSEGQRQLATCAPCAPSANSSTTISRAIASFGAAKHPSTSPTMLASWPRSSPFKRRCDVASLDAVSWSKSTHRVIC